MDAELGSVCDMSISRLPIFERFSIEFADKEMQKGRGKERKSPPTKRKQVPISLFSCRNSYIVSFPTLNEEPLARTCVLSCVYA